MGYGFKVKVDASKAIARLSKLSQRLDKKEVLSFIGEHLLYWINKNFKDEGTEKKWKALSANTKVTRGSGARILQDTGRLRMSFVKNVSVDQVKVGSEDPRAEWHQEGTAPYDIYPRYKKALMFMTTGGKTFSKHVRHPGLVARPMLPSENLAKNIANVALKAYIDVIVKNAKGV